VQQTSLTLLSREGVRRQTIEVGLLTDGSSYSPTPSRWITHQWLPQLAFVPDHSGASVRELHPLPACSTSIAITEKISRKNISPEPTDVKAILPEGLYYPWCGETSQGSVHGHSTAASCESTGVATRRESGYMESKDR
jgi:hypothetical protein